MQYFNWQLPMQFAIHSLFWKLHQYPDRPKQLRDMRQCLYKWFMCFRKLYSSMPLPMHSWSKTMLWNRIPDMYF